MEDGLRESCPPLKKLKKVLILVLMEDGLRVNEINAGGSAYPVLIIVLMEDGLRAIFSRVRSVTLLVS